MKSFFIHNTLQKHIYLSILYNFTKSNAIAFLDKIGK